MKIKVFAEARRYATRDETRAFLQRKFDDLNTQWLVGMPCLAYRGSEVTTIVKLEGDAAYLANGDSMHISRMRRAPNYKY